jgi:hypothetical protein
MQKTSHKNYIKSGQKEYEENFQGLPKATFVDYLKTLPKSWFLLNGKTLNKKNISKWMIRK